jgi:hypothetical protein
MPTKGLCMIVFAMSSLSAFACNPQLLPVESSGIMISSQSLSVRALGLNVSLAHFQGPSRGDMAEGLRFQGEFILGEKKYAFTLNKWPRNDGSLYYETQLREFSWGERAGSEKVLTLSEVANSRGPRSSGKFSAELSQLKFNQHYQVRDCHLELMRE